MVNVLRGTPSRVMSMFVPSKPGRSATWMSKPLIWPMMP
jgi:hypothetical protein